MTADKRGRFAANKKRDVYGINEKRRLRQTRIRTFTAYNKRRLWQKSNLTFTADKQKLALNIYGQPKGKYLRPRRKGRLSRRNKRMLAID